MTADPPLTTSALPAPQPRKRRGFSILAALAVVLALGGATVLVAGFTGVIPLPGMQRTFTVHGSLRITAACGQLGYDDLQAGTQVVLTDASQKVLSVGALRPVSDWNHPNWCLYEFTLADVPAGGKFYGLTISHQETVQYTERQLRDGPVLVLG